MERVIRVDSSAQREFDPDIIRVGIFLNGSFSSHRLCAEAYEKELSLLKKGLLEAGVGPDELKDSSVQIYKGRRKRRGSDRYEYSSRLTFETKVDDGRFAGIWNVLVDLGDRVSFDMRFDLSDYKAARKQLLSEAVEEGRREAEELASMTGCALGRAVCINNSSSGGRYGYGYDDGYGYGLACASPSGVSEGRSAPEFNPRAISISCNLHLEWELIDA